ncbi:MAG: cobyrinate a,c-diamide synthase [Cyanobacteria bacterium P01_D01_bin.50]
MAVIIAGERSGVGKTTVTLTLLSCLTRRGLQVQSFKVGPDYIDPMFHKYVTNRACRNLDPVLTSEGYVKECFDRHSNLCEYALIEGVMGLFDGVSTPPLPLSLLRGGVNEEQTSVKGGVNDFASTAHIAKLLNLPVLLVIDCSRLSGSVAAIAHGYRSFDKEVNIAGVILNRVGSDRHLSLLKNSLEALQIPIFGVLKRQENITISDRHLGLVPTAELPQLNQLIDKLVTLGENCFDWESLLPLLLSRQGDKETISTPSTPSTPRHFLQRREPPQRSGSSLPRHFLQRREPPQRSGSSPPRHFLQRREPPQRSGSSPPSTIKIAVAYDKAFNFYYQDNLDLLQTLGAELIFWSPLKDTELPKDIGGMYFGGGFPEVFAEKLAENSSARDSVKAAIFSGMPTIAECGGLMYCAEQIVDMKGKSWEMVGILPTTAVMDKHLTLGYRRAIALQDSLLVDTGKTIYGHEFHRSSLISDSNKPLFQTYRFDCDEFTGKEGWISPSNLHASYIHMHWGNSTEIPQRFLESCRVFNRACKLNPSP